MSEARHATPRMADRPIGTALMVVLSILIPLAGIVWGIIRIARGDIWFGAGVIAMSAALWALIILLA